MHISALIELAAHVIDKLPNAQKLELFETLAECDDLQVGAEATHEVAIVDGVEWVTCTIKGVTAFTFHY